MSIKLNVGASPIWRKDGWLVLDHKPSRKDQSALVGDAEDIPCRDGSCAVLFCSHMLEHVPHFKTAKILKEFHRVLEDDGMLRILVPDMLKAAKAYVENDRDFYEKALAEDENLRTDLGYGGFFMNFIVSPGQDTALLNRNLDKFIGGYGHIYAYDFKMLEILLKRCGFDDIRQKDFCDSSVPELREPLHVEGLPPVWNILNQDFYNKHGLIHKYENGKYNISFSITGFDRDPDTSLIVEARKSPAGTKMPDDAPGKNFDAYSRSILNDEGFTERLDEMGVSYYDDNKSTADGRAE